MTYNDWNVSTINDNLKYLKNVRIFRFKLGLKQYHPRVCIVSEYFFHKNSLRN